MFFSFDKRSLFLGEGEVNRGNYPKFVTLLTRIDQPVRGVRGLEGSPSDDRKGSHLPPRDSASPGFDRITFPAVYGDTASHSVLEGALRAT